MDYKGKNGYLLVQKNMHMHYIGCKICAKWTSGERNQYTWKSPGFQIWHQLNYTLVTHWLWCSMKNEQTLPGSDIHSDQNLLFAKICTRFKKIIRFQKVKPQCDLENLYAKQQTVPDTLEEELSAIKYEIGTVEVQRNNIKKHVLVLWVIWCGELRGQQESHRSHRKQSVKMDE